MPTYTVLSKVGAKRIPLKDVIITDSVVSARAIAKTHHRGAWKFEIVSVKKESDSYLYHPKDKRYKPKKAK